MKTVIVLAMHGAPPTDYPQIEIGEMFALHARLERAAGPERAQLERRHAQLEARVRAWPRTPQNDPFYAGSQELGEQLKQATGCDVVVGFNEFCAPSLGEAIDQAVAGAADAKRIVVITPMVTRGGEHSEVDIPSAIRRAQERHPETAIVYVWPFQASDVAAFLAAQIERQFEQTHTPWALEARTAG